MSLLHRALPRLLVALLIGIPGASTGPAELDCRKYVSYEACTPAYACPPGASGMARAIRHCVGGDVHGLEESCGCNSLENIEAALPLTEVNKQEVCSPPVPPEDPYSGALVDENYDGCVNEGKFVGLDECGSQTACIGVLEVCDEPPEAVPQDPRKKPETCNGMDDNCNDLIDEGCDVKGPEAGGEGDGEDASFCDTGGADPIVYSTRSVVTEPFADLRVGGAPSLAFSRTYQSKDGSVVGDTMPGVFGPGWHHDWEANLSCSTAYSLAAPPVAICTVRRGLLSGTRYRAAGTGFSEELGENVRVFTSSWNPLEPDGDGGVLVLRPTGEWIAYSTKGRELHFATVCDACSAGDDPLCLDPLQGGTARLVRIVNRGGDPVTVSYDRPAGVLISLRDNFGRELALKSPFSCSGTRAETLEFRGGQGEPFTMLATFGYSAGRLIAVTDADSRSIRSYEYEAGRPSLLTKIRNEAGDPIVEFGYDDNGDAVTLVDSATFLQVAYPDETTTTTVHRTATSGGRSSSGGRSHGSGGVTSAWQMERQRILMARAMRKLTCIRDAEGRVTWRDLDAWGRVTRVARYRANADFTCVGSPDPADLIDEEFYEYGLERPIIDGVAVKLDEPTRVARKSALSATEYAGTSTDYDPAPRPYDPAGYYCSQSTGRVGSAPCRLIEDGFTQDATGAVVYERHATFFAYDERGRLVRTIGPLNLDRPSYRDVAPIEERTYWPDHESGARRGLLREVKRYPSPGAPPLVFAVDYDMFGVYTLTDSDQRVSRYLRDGRGRVITRVGFDGRTIRIRYHDGGSPRLVLLESGASRLAAYDIRGRLRSIERMYGDPELDPVAVSRGDKIEVGYDDAGNAQFVQRTDALGVAHWKRQRVYDPDHQLREEWHPEDPAQRASWEYDDTGILALMVDEEGRRTQFVPDDLGRPREIIRESSADAAVQASTVVASYAYGQGIDAPVTVTDGAGRATSYSHDDFGRTVRVASPATFKDAGPYQFEFDARGNVLRRTGGGVTLEYSYDGLDRMVAVRGSRDTGGPAVEINLAYDLENQRGRLAAATDAGRTTWFTWDPVGRLRYETTTFPGESGLRVTEYRYDVDGDLDTIVYPSGLAVTYERDDRTKEVIAVREAGSNRPWATAVTWEPLGPLKALAFGNGQSLVQTFNLRYEPETIQSGPVNLAYGMSATGNVAGVFEGAAAIGFTHDLLDRLSGFSPGHGTTEVLEYQYAGDRLISAWSNGVRRHAYAYDEQSNVSSIASYDVTGTSVLQVVCLLHDALGRLVMVGRGPATLGGPDGPGCRQEADVEEVLARFEYDASNRRIARIDGATGRRTFFALAPAGDTLGEYEQTGDSAAPWRTLREYVWLDGRPLAQEEHLTGVGRLTYAIHTDHIGLPRALTNGNGQVVWRAEARPYGDIGEVTSPDPASGRTVVTNLRLPGQYDERLLGSLGLQGPYYNWNRWYLPSVGRYLELDPIAKAGEFNGFYGPNWYGYAEGNPLRWTDRRGLDIWIEGPSGNEPFAHQSINIGDPFGTYVSLSFGLDANLGGVYFDTTKGGPIESYLRTSAEQDSNALALLLKLREQDSKRLYGGTTCRTYSQDNFRALAYSLHVVPTAPPIRTPTPWDGWWRILLAGLLGSGLSTGL